MLIVEQASEIPLTGSPALARARAFLVPLLDRLAIDRTVVLGVSAKLWQATASLVTIAVIAVYLTPQAQGYYYTFLNLMALQVFAELGLGSVVVNFASHEWARLQLEEGKRITGSEEALGRLISLGRFAFRWYLVAGAAVFFVVGTAGWSFFARSPDTVVRWELPWISFCLLIAVRLWGIPFFALLEGCNQVGDVYLCRLVDAVVTSVTLWLCIVLGWGLSAVCLSAAAGVLWCGVFLVCRFGGFFGQFLAKPRVGISWRNEILPMQWRIALSFLGGYFTFYLLTPLTFKFEGPAAAGRMGMTFAVASGLSTVASMWIYTRVPRFGIMVAGRRFEELDRLFHRLLFTSVTVLFAGALSVWLLACVLHVQGSLLSSRVLPPLPMGMLLLASLLMQVSLSQAAYLRAHKKEPFLTLSVAQGILTCLSLLVLGRHYGTLGMITGYLGVVTLFTLPYGTYLWRRCRNEWHSEHAQL